MIASSALADRWILSRLDEAIREVSSSIDAYEFNVAAMKRLPVHLARVL